MLESLVAHIGIAHGAGAALVSLAIFYLVGILLMPRSMQSRVRWPDCVALAIALYVVLCWVAVSAWHTPVIYVASLFAAVAWLLLVLRLRWALRPLRARLLHPATRRWLIEFCLLYVLAYILIRPAPGRGLLPLAPEGSLDLVTYARYARQVLEIGIPNVELAAFDYMRSPAGIFLLAWQSLQFGRDPLEAAIPVLFMLAALFGMMAAEAVRAAFSVSKRAAFAIAALGMCAPVFRWSLTTYSLAELMTATALLAGVGALVRAASRKQPAGLLPSIAACGVLLWFAAPTSAWRPASIATGFSEIWSMFSPAALAGLPQSTPIGARTSASSIVATALVLAVVPLLWAAALYVFRRSGVVERIASSETDRQLACSLAAYVVAAIVVGNVAIHAVHGPETIRRSGAWRQLGEVSRTQFQGITLRVTDQPDGLSTALALYYLRDRKAEVFGPDTTPESLSFDTVSRQQPMLIQDFSCDGVGHSDTVSVRGVGCLLLAPPSMTLEEPYHFNRTYLFLTYDRTERDPNGRWNTSPTLNLEVTADPQRARLDSDRFMNVLVHPFLPEGVKPHRLVLRWGAGQHGEILVADRRWFSLPVRSGDWHGNRLWKLPIAIDIPDGKKILFQAITLTESPSGEVIAPAARPIR